jgi:hypothetical protein
MVPKTHYSLTIGLKNVFVQHKLYKILLEFHAEKLVLRNYCSYQIYAVA